MAEKLRVGIVGCGSFAKNFVPLFQNHPHVEYVCVTDLMPARAQEYHEKFGVDVVSTYEEMLKSDVNCIAVFVQRHLHGPIVIKALEAGKHVYCAVPMASTIEECKRIVELVKEKHLTYMMGETCYYYPCACFCRKMYKEGRFGKFVYGASQYYHDIAEFDFLVETEGYRWRQAAAGLPPFLYPTHSFGMILSSVDAHVVKLSCMGYRDTEDDNIYGEGKNDWNNPYSNMYALCQLSNGGTARVTEARRIGVFKPSSYISAVYGTKAGYEYSNAQHLFVEAPGKEKAKLTDVSDLVNPEEMTANKNDPDFKEKVANAAWSWASTAPIQYTDHLPESFKELPNGHMATHKLLIDDFCRAAYENKLPVVDAWTAARYTIPGIVAVESAYQGGVLMDVPDLGDSPAGWERIDTKTEA
ncbi:MAG: Gfo/Idh/MocA family oxidoreductase [Clostridiales bacterium]|nr:Gfo/Idh/MocA family oxidoreductase [Clostridiales bacterium]